MTNSTNNQIDMNYHLSCYWIISSHNTCLPYGQIGTRTSTCYYNLVLQLYEGGCVEIDLVRLTKDNLDIKVSHDTQIFSYVSKGHIKLSSIVEVLLRIMKRKTKYNKITGPVILSIDNKGNISELEKLFFKIIEPLNEYIYDNKNDYNKIPLSKLTNKIIINWCTQLDYKNNSKCIVENSSKIAMRSTSFKFNEFISADSQVIGIAYSKDETIKINYLTTFLNTLTNFIRTFPKGLSINVFSSNNYKVDHLFKSGIQLVSLNMQKPDKFWFINRAIFHKDYDEISYAPYILKPKWLLGLEPFPNYYNVDINCDDIIKIEYVGNNLPQTTNISSFKNIDMTLPIFYIEYNKDNIIYRNAIKLDIEISTYKLKLFNIKDEIMQYKIDSPEHDDGTGINDCENQKYPLTDEFTYITLNVTFEKSDEPLPSDIQEYNKYWEEYNKINKNNNLIEWQQGLIKFMKDKLKLI
jgi:hypothetical protein